MEVKKYEKIILDSSRSIDDIVASVKAELSKQESKNAGESYICYVSHAYSSGDNAGANYIVVSDGFKELKRLSSNVIQISPYNKDEINELIATNISTKANANAVVNLTDNQTIEGVKTFSSVPVVATEPTNDNQVVNKAYVDSKSSELNSRIDGVNITKASWGLNWNAPVLINNMPISRGEVEMIDDGVVFLWGGDFGMTRYNINEYFEDPEGYDFPTEFSTFKFSPKNYRFRYDERPIFDIPDIFVDAGQDMDLRQTGIFYIYGKNSLSLTNTLSTIPVRKGDKVLIQRQTLNPTGSITHNPNCLISVFYPFEK